VTLDAESAIVIVGAGQAGFQTAASLREQGYAGRVVLIGDEASLPYQRPPLSKAHLKLDAEDAQLHFRPDAFFAEKRIELRAPDRVTAIDRAAPTGRASISMACTCCAPSRMHAASGPGCRPRRAS
jgi:3-phenylpropionate/trans-cinnamate dioxygenase ferredoxin reductase subunit